MPEHPIETDLKSAALAVRHARDVRKFHARRTERGSEQRESDLQQAAERLARSMKPLRTFIGRETYKRNSHHREDLLERVREASRALQSERRKLWKMRDHSNRKQNTPDGQQIAPDVVRDINADTAEGSSSKPHQQDFDAGLA